MARPTTLFRSASSFALLTGLFAAGVSMPAAFALAQDAPAAASAKKAPVTEQEVIVTATKRKQKAQDVALDLTVLGAAQLKNLPQIKQTNDVIQFIPNAQGASSEGKARPRYFVRGLGTNNVNFNAINPLGTYYDDVYIANVYNQALPLYDLDHIEALEGPQGTLWGKNANAGAINFISKAPTFKNDAYVTLGGGSFGEFRAEGAVGGALIPGKLAGRLSFYHDGDDGWQHNKWNGQDYGSENETAVRQQFLVTPTDDLSVLLNVHLRNYDGANRGVGFINDPLDGFTGAAFTPYYKGVRQPATAYDEVNVAGPNSTHINEKGASAKVTWDPGKFTVTSITAYEGNVYDVLTGATGGVPVSGIAAPPGALNAALTQFWGPATPGATPTSLSTQNTNYWQFSQELRIASPERNRFTWLAGLYGFAEGQSSTTWTGVFAPNVNLIGTAAAGGAGAGAFGQSPVSPQLAFFPWNQDTHSYAGFANLGYKITSRLKISGGVRWTTEHTAIDSSFADIGGATQAAVNANPALVNRINPSNYTTVATTSVASFSDAQTQRNWTYDFTPEFKITDNVKTYFRYARGALPGNFSFQPYVVPNGFGGNASLFTAKPLRLKSEELDAFEIGLKTQWFDKRLTANGTVFHYDYNNAATNVPTAVPGLAVPAVLFINAGGESVDGADIALDAKITPRLHIGGNAGLLRAVYNSDAINKADGIAGQNVPRSPRLTTSLYASYNQDLPFGGNLIYAGDVNFRSKFYFYPTATTQSAKNAAGFVDQQTQTAYALVNTSLTWYPTDKSQTSLQFSVLNLFDQHYTILKLQNGYGANAVYNGQPRSFFVSVTSKFF